MEVEKVVSVAEVKDLIEKGLTHQQISDQLKDANSNSSGLSAMSVRRFCAKYNIRKNCCMENEDLKKEVRQCVMQVKILNIFN